jgi:hypothetical protein
MLRFFLVFLCKLIDCNARKLQSGNIIHDEVENLMCAIKKFVSKLIKALEREKRQSSEKPRGSLKGAVSEFSHLPCVLFKETIIF